MTKKSQSRLARDAEKKGLQDTGESTPFDFSTNTAWTDLSAVMQAAENILFPILEFAQAISAGQNEHLKNFYPDWRSTSLNMVTFGRDLTRTYSEFLAIRDLHINRIGNAANDAEMMEAYRLNAAYAALIENMNGTLIPTFNHLTEDFYLAQQSCQRQAQAEQQALNAQDPTVVTDVQVRDVSAAVPASTTVQ